MQVDDDVVERPSGEVDCLGDSLGIQVVHMERVRGHIDDPDPGRVRGGDVEQRLGVATFCLVPP